MNAALAARPPQRIDPLVERAVRLWPDDPRNQREWLRAVSVVRASRNGWLLERRVRRCA